MTRKAYYIDLTGKVFGKWTVIKRDGKAENRGEPLWLCECSCDKKTTKRVRGVLLRSGKSTNCGCVRLEKLKITQQNLKKFNEYFEVDEDTICGISSSKDKSKFYISKIDYNLVKNNNWRTNNYGYIYTTVERKSFTIQSLILDSPKEKIDHIDRNKLNNKRENLRLVSNKENGRNISKSFDNTSGFIGVCEARFLVKEGQMWRARINADGKEYTKCFKTKEEAIIQRLKWELKYFGPDFSPQRHLFTEYGITDEPEQPEQSN